MTALFAASLVLAQAATPAVPVTLEDDRLTACMAEARSDPAQAITTAVGWLEGLSGAAISRPQQCLGFAFMGLLRWQAAKDSFVLARNALPPSDLAERARLGAMAGNAALAGDANGQALVLLQAAQDDAVSAGNFELAGQAAADKARALVDLGRDVDASTALEEARGHAPQNAEIWLLSATLARRMNDLPAAQGWIEAAASLDPANPLIGLEAGVIAALGGYVDAARRSWLSVIETAGGSPQAATARAYLQQLEGDMPER